MPVLKSLSFAALPKNTNDPVYVRRAQFISKLEEQKQLLEDPGYVRTVHRTTEIEGQKQVVVRKQRVKPSWKTDPSGLIVMSIKFGAKPIEFEKGMRTDPIITPTVFKWNGVTIYQAITADDVMHISIYYEGGTVFEPLKPDPA
ncbi:MAG TPA: hypothetical protein VMT72_10495 [Pseudolabrys sp.]|nr:hypothetical protein [Pseudolabrys sp.]